MKEFLGYWYFFSVLLAIGYAIEGKTFLGIFMLVHLLVTLLVNAGANIFNRLFPKKTEAP